MKFQSLYVNILLIGLFVLAMFSFLVTFAVNNNASININQNKILNASFGGVSASLQNSSAQAQSQRNALESESSNPVVTALGFIFNSILSTGKVFTQMIYAIFDNLFQSMITLFGVSPIVMGVITAIIIGSIVLALWRVYRAGE